MTGKVRVLGCLGNRRRIGSNDNCVFAIVTEEKMRYTVEKRVKEMK